MNWLIVGLAVVVVLVLLIVYLRVLFTESRCAHEFVFPGRHIDTDLFYVMCARCNRVRIGLDGKWLKPEEAAERLAVMAQFVARQSAASKEE